MRHQRRATRSARTKSRTRKLSVPIGRTEWPTKIADSPHDAKIGPIKSNRRQIASGGVVPGSERRRGRRKRRFGDERRPAQAACAPGAADRERGPSDRQLRRRRRAVERRASGAPFRRTPGGRLAVAHHPRTLRRPHDLPARRLPARDRAVGGRFPARRDAPARRPDRTPERRRGTGREPHRGGARPLVRRCALGPCGVLVRTRRDAAPERAALLALRSPQRRLLPRPATPRGARRHRRSRELRAAPGTPPGPASDRVVSIRTAGGRAAGGRCTAPVAARRARD